MIPLFPRSVIHAYVLRRKFIHIGRIKINTIKPFCPSLLSFRISPSGNVTTLGRGGSDTTAVVLAAFLKADMCQIFTDVDGVYDRDPRRYPDANRFSRISYEKMMGLIQSGAQVLHDRSVEFAREYGITVEVLSAFTGAPGTLVGPTD